MRYIKHHLEGIVGVEIYPMISLLLFFFFFVALVIYVLRADKKFIEYMESRPFEKDSADTTH